jgi:hypothetical protein
MGVRLKAGLITSIEKKSIFGNIKTAFVGGIWGYILFFGILIMTKAVSGFVLSEGGLKIETPDFILPVIGFVLLFIIKFLENYKEDNP